MIDKGAPIWKYIKEARSLPQDSHCQKACMSLHSAVCSHKLCQWQYPHLQLVPTHQALTSTEMAPGLYLCKEHVPPLAVFTIPSISLEMCKFVLEPPGHSAFLKHFIQPQT